MHPYCTPKRPLFDTVIVVNLLGNGVSTSPSNILAPDDRDRYPLITVFDNVQAQVSISVFFLCLFSVFF